MSEKIRSVATFKCRHCLVSFDKEFFCNFLETSDSGKFTEPHDCEGTLNTVCSKKMVGIAEMISARMAPQ